jgi:hypothetical protein
MLYAKRSESTSKSLKGNSVDVLYTETIILMVFTRPGMKGLANTMLPVDKKNAMVLHIPLQGITTALRTKPIGWSVGS